MNESFEIVIKPKSKWQLIDLKEIWRYRELFYIFAWRDIKVRYKQTYLGVVWALFQPLVSMIIFTIFFGSLAKIPSGSLPYPLFVLTGLAFWNYFSGILSRSSNSLVENEGIIKKIYFPRVILPLSTIGANLLDFLISFTLLLLVSVYFKFIPNISILLIIPICLLITTLGACGLGLIFSAFNVKYRDVRHALPFFIQILIFLTPVIYPTNIMRPMFRLAMGLNPVAGAIEAARTIFIISPVVNWNMLMISGLSSVVILLLGLYYFRSTEKFFADIV